MEKFRSKTRLYKVYHIRVKGDSNIQGGYVGVTRRSLSSRLSQHFHSKRPVGKVLRTFDKNDIEIVEIDRLEKESALNLEYQLRPKRFIGWNEMAGGNRSTVKCPSCGKPLPKRRSGSYCEDCNNCKFTKGHVPNNYGKGEKYKLTSPNGSVFYPDVFTIFCAENQLTPQNLRKVAKGRRKHHKGWLAVRLITQ